MPESYTALSADVEEDLLPLSALLHQQGIAHRVIENQGRQELMVTQPGQVEVVRSLYQSWRSGELQIEMRPGAGRSRGATRTGVNWRVAPLTLLLIVLSIAGFALVYFRFPVEWLSLLSFSPLHVVDGRPVFESAQGQYWRLVTPAFIHFGWLHIVFNSLWMWELGARVERVMGHLNMLLLFLVIAVVSNTSQFVYTGPGLFGGMSGVVYGLLGFSWVAPLLQPRWVIQPPRAIMLFMVGWLVICMAGVVEVLGFGAIANAAHLGGLISGAVLGAAFGLLSRLGDEKTR